MRIDKFLWSIRLYKTRSIAADEIKKGRVKIVDQLVKASREVKQGDTIDVRKNQVNLKIRVLDLPKSRVGAKLVGLYIQDLTPKEEYEMLELRRKSQQYYREKGEGRPTKKDRREIEGYVDGSTASSEGDFSDASYWDRFFSQDDEDSLE